MMNCMQMIYLISIALQVSGALILILFCWKNVLLNRTAFILIGLGYLLSIFGVNEGICAWKGLVIVVVASVVIVAIGVFAIHTIAKTCNRKDRIYQYEELCSKLDSDVATNMIYSEIDEAFKI